MLKLRLQYFGHLMRRDYSVEKSLMLGKIEGRGKRASEDEMAGWHHRCNGHERGQTLGDGEGQGGLACCSLWGHRESDMTGQLNNSPSTAVSLHFQSFSHYLFLFSSLLHVSFTVKTKFIRLLNFNLFYFSSVQFSHSVMSDSLRPHEPQHTRPSCPSPTPGVHPNPCPLSQ